MIVPEARRLLERWIFVLVDVNSEYLVPYTLERRNRIEEHGGYGPSFSSFLNRFLECLAGAEWPAGTFYPGGWFRSLVQGGQEPTRAEITPAALQRFHQEEFVIDVDGTWRVGNKTVEGRIKRYFLEHLHFDGDLQRYFIRYPLESRSEMRYLHHNSPPLRVMGVFWEKDRVELLLNDGSREPLRADTLRMDGVERLYCAVGAQGLPVWFENNPRWQLLQHVSEKEGRFYLARGDGEAPLDLDEPLDFPGGLVPLLR